jgi:ABC-type multidrug transport system permease subunit
MKTYHPILELLLSRMRSFYREPEAMFWTYGFPILLTVGLGIAFRAKPPEKVAVAIEDVPALAAAREALTGNDSFQARVCTGRECDEVIRKGDSAVALVNSGAGLEYRFDPTRPEAALARLKVNDALQAAAGQTDPIAIADRHVTARGARYIDFLVPGLLGMNLMGGGLWGIGFVTVDMRIRKLLKRLVATPMRKRDFLLSLIGARMIFTLPETVVILAAGWLIFEIAIEGNLLSIAIVAAVGALSFAGMGLLAASRARKLETISGLMNIIMLPMWIFSGIFFSATQFPDVLQPFIQLLPLTQLNNALRAVITDGASLASQAVPLSILTAYGVVSFGLALRWFRWT